MAILLGAWVLASVLFTTLIGYFLHAAQNPRLPPKRSAADSRYRPSAWTQVPPRRQGHSRHNPGYLSARRREARSPRAG